MPGPGNRPFPSPEQTAERRRAAQHYYDLGRRLEQAAAFQDQEWCQEYQAVDDHGQATLAQAPGAARYCAIGLALRAARDEIQGLAMVLTLRAALPEEPSLPDWNDDPARQPEEVRELFRAASRKCYQAALAQGRPAAEPRPPRAAARRS